MRNEPKFSNVLSARIVCLLKDQSHMTLKEIGRLMILSESFISRVKHAKSTLTLDHLDLLARSLNLDLSVLVSDQAPDLKRVIEAGWKIKIEARKRK